MPNATKAAILADVTRVQNLLPSGKVITRDEYVKQGEYSKHELNKHWSSWKDILLELAFGVEIPSSDPDETSTESNDHWTLNLKKTRIHTLAQLIEYFEVDTQIWEVERFIANKWEMGYTTGIAETKTALTVPLYQVKATFKKKKDVEAVIKEIADLFAEAKENAPEPLPIFREKSPLSGNMLEVNIPDVHFGKLAWGEETGHENYDNKIAERIYERAVDGLVFRSRGYRFDEVVFVVGNDLLQADDTEGRTTSGTVVTTDGRYQKTFRTARRAVINAIEKLRSIAPVRVIVVPGNHDELSAWHLGESLAIWFSKYSDVTVENEPTPRKYHQFGKVGLMYCHGHKGKRTDYPLQFATERPDIWGATIFREVHCGHEHKTKMDEYHGCRVRVLPALCPPDDWHSQMGFTGNLRSAEGFVWNRDEGLIAHIYYNDDNQPLVETRQVIV
jgi:hypothetical protein